MGRESALRPRALIVEDEILIAPGLKEEMRAGDVYLNGARDGIEAARWLRDVCGSPVIFITAYTDSSGTPFCFPLTSFRRFSFPLPVEPSTEEGLSYLYRRGAGPFATVLQRHE
jgi:hypothetical protein